jgi:hypothetical protein
MSEQRDMSGTLNRNADKTEPGGNPAWPDYKGSLRVDGRDYWLSGWIKDGPHGKFLSLAVKPKDAPAAPRTDDSGPENDGMPF